MFKKSIALIICLTTFSISFAADMKSRIKEWKTNEGARVLFIAAPEIPMIDVIVSMDAGELREGKHYGLTSMTASMLQLGTIDKDEDQFSEALESLGSTISISSNVTRTNISMRSLTDPSILEPSLKLWEEMVTSPRFDSNIFDRERTQAIDAQKALLDNASGLARQLYNSTLYPNGIQGVTSEMLQKSLATLKINDIKEFRKKYYHATGANIVIVGAIDEAQAKKLSQKLSSILGKGKNEPLKSEQAPKVTADTHYLYFNSPQTNILMGEISIDRFSPDYFPLILGNHVFGGSGLTSLLMMDIREKQGLTYGIYSYFAPTFLHGPFTIGLATKNESVDHAITATIAKTKEFIVNGPDDVDLDRAKNNLIGTSILGLSSNSSLAGALLTIAEYNLPLDYYDTYPDKIRAITKEEIQKAFAKHINPDNFSIIIVGGEEPKKS